MAGKGIRNPNDWRIRVLLWHMIAYKEIRIRKEETPILVLPLAPYDLVKTDLGVARAQN